MLNVKHGGIGLGIDSRSWPLILRSWQKKRLKSPGVYVKLSPNVTNIVEIAKAVEEAGADGIVLINTLMGMRLDLKTETDFLRIRLVV